MPSETRTSSVAKHMKVVSIDPAPSKNAVIFDGAFTHMSACDLPAYCSELAHQDTILCWDAPLTGPPAIGNNSFGASYSQRIIERFFSRNSTDLKTPAGISVLPYSGCPHWAITRASVGLPRVGLFDSETTLPFRLIADNDFDRTSGRWIVESHPAVAIWLWCRNSTELPDTETWVHKGRPPSRTIEELWGRLTAKWNASGIDKIKSTVTSMDVPANDDQLDAVTGWVLGMMLLYKDQSVSVLGNKETGAIVLPTSEALTQSFKNFCSLKENAT